MNKMTIINNTQSTSSQPARAIVYSVNPPYCKRNEWPILLKDLKTGEVSAVKDALTMSICSIGGSIYCGRLNAIRFHGGRLYGQYENQVIDIISGEKKFGLASDFVILDDTLFAMGGLNHNYYLDDALFDVRTGKAHITTEHLRAVGLEHIVGVTSHNGEVIALIETVSKENASVLKYYTLEKKNDQWSIGRFLANHPSECAERGNEKMAPPIVKYGKFTYAHWDPPRGMRFGSTPRIRSCKGLLFSTTGLLEDRIYVQRDPRDSRLLYIKIDCIPQQFEFDEVGKVLYLRFNRDNSFTIDKLNITFTNQEIKLSRFKRVTKEKLIGSENVYLLSADTERGDDEDISPTLGAFALLSEEQYKQLFLVMKKAKAVKRK